MNKFEAAQKANPDLNKIYCDVVRPDGHLETLDLSAKFFGMTAPLAAKIKSATAKAGRGTVTRIYRKAIKTNLAELEREYNNFMNEGGEGYIPDLSNDPRVTVEVVTEVW